jgi:hypothetical protein
MQTEQQKNLKNNNNIAIFHRLRTKTIPSCIRTQGSFVYGWRNTPVCATSNPRRNNTQGTHPPPPKIKIKIKLNHHCPIIDSGKNADTSEQTLLREAQQHLERARALDPDGVVAQAFIHRVRQAFFNVPLSFHCQLI